jgi:hypothetical protein
MEKLENLSSNYASTLDYTSGEDIFQDDKP